jgi:hypothetical protein
MSFGLTWLHQSESYFFSTGKERKGKERGGSMEMVRDSVRFFVVGIF